jgi:hypothetical protein
MSRVLAVLAIVAGVALAGAGVPASAAPGGPATSEVAPGGAGPQLPVLAYYYQWFDPPSWNRAKIDYPVLGRYSSDDPGVMRRHVRDAKAAGITGFIVSWKSTDENNRRLHALADVARSERFSLAVIYQGLDFERDALPVDRVAADLRFYRDTFAGDPVFHVLGRPLLIWSGTWKFSHDELASAVAPIRADVTVLASEKDNAGYTRVADVVDGNAYYWSSVDPTQFAGFGERLKQMSELVHRSGGIWVAPFAPGFDARLVGGTRAVDRRDGATLRTEYAAAVRSSPDVLGLISWNEFSENTHVEPSLRFGDRYLQVLRTLLTTPVDTAAGEAAQDSSDTAQDPTDTAQDSGDDAGDLPVGPARVLTATGVALAGVVALRLYRRRRTRLTAPEGTETR